MTGALLRTGNLKAFEPLGALGNPVYLAAPQVRAAIGRHLGAEVAGVLAIPRRNQDGDTIDWYAPGAGPVVPWSAATPEERAQASDQLVAIRKRIQDLGRAMQSEEAGERRTFGHLLEQVTSFPGDEHVYLVNGRPVITFWGFRKQNAPVGGNPLLSPDVVPKSAPVEERGRRLSGWWLLALLLALVLLLVWLLRGCEEPPPPPVDEPQEAFTPQVPASADREAGRPEAPAGQEITEPEPHADPDRPGRVVRGGQTTVVEHDGIATEHARVVGEAVEVDAAPGDAVEDAAPPDDVESTNILDGEAEGTQIEAGGIDTLTENADAGGTGAEDLAQLTEESEGSEEAAKDALPDTHVDEAGGADEHATPSLPEEAPDEPTAPEHADEPPFPAEAADSETLPSDTPDYGAPDRAKTPDRATSETAEEQGDPGERRAPGEGPKPGTAAPRQGDAEPSLKPSPGAVDAGTTQFLNGGWRTSTSLQDPRTALPVDMEYRLDDGTGDLTLKRSDGSVCSGQVKAVIEDGKLVVQNARDIRCPDGTNFGRPRLECIPVEDGRADCSGRYETGEVFSVDIKKSE